MSPWSSVISTAAAEGAWVRVDGHLVLDESRRVQYHFVLVDYVCRAIGGRLAPGSDVSDVIVVDLAGVSFLDSSGCNALVQGKRRADGHGVGLELAQLSPACRRLFEIAGLLDLFTIRG